MAGGYGWLGDPADAFLARVTAIERRLSMLERGLDASTRAVAAGLLVSVTVAAGDPVTVPVPDASVVLASGPVSLGTPRNLLIVVSAHLAVGDAVTALLGVARREAGTSVWSHVPPGGLPVTVDGDAQATVTDLAVPAGRWEWGVRVQAIGVSQSVTTSPWWQLVVLDVGGS